MNLNKPEEKTSHKAQHQLINELGDVVTAKVQFYLSKLQTSKTKTSRLYYQKKIKKTLGKLADLVDLGYTGENISE